MAHIVPGTDKLMMSREQFPVTFPYPEEPNVGIFNLNYNMIPPLHGSIAGGGIDIVSAISVFEEAMEETYRDFLDARQAHVFTSIEPYVVKDFIRYWKREFEADEWHAKLGRNHPQMETVITRKGISNRSAGNRLKVEINGDRASYFMPSGMTLSDELAGEYMLKGAMIGEKDGILSYMTHNTGWTLQESDAKGPPIPIFYKNIVIALNNAAVAAKYGK